MLLFALLLAAEAPAVTTPTAQAEPEEKIYCKREGATDTRIRTKKVCRKQSEWDSIAKEAQDEVRRSTNQKSIPAN